MQNWEFNQRSKKGFALLIAILSGMLIVAIGLGIALFVNSQSELYSISAQQRSEESAKESNEPGITSPTTQIIDLVSLMGKTQASAIESIGHGAEIQDQETLNSLGFSDQVRVVLTEEKGDNYAGTPTVTLGFDDDDKVTAAAYEVSTSLIGYGDLAFAPAVEQFHIVEFVLQKAGLVSIEQGCVSLPDRQEYSTYASDGKTLERELWSFTGSQTEGDQEFTWQVTLDYDYSQANEQSNLAYTIKRISVAIMKA